MNAAALDIIKRSEGLRLVAYLCPAGVPTIGYGSTKGVTLADVHAGRKITAKTAEIMLLREVKEIEDGVLGACTIEPNENQLGAMVCLAYNIGLGWSGTKRPAGEKGGFRQSSVLKAHNRGDAAAAANAFGLWTKATVDGQKVVLPGLVSRRAAEAALYLTPVAGAAEPIAQAIEPEKPMQQSRTIQAGSLATMAPMLAMASEAARQVAEIRDAMGPWLPYAILAVGVAAGVWVIYERLSQRKRGEA